MQNLKANYVFGSLSSKRVLVDWETIHANHLQCDPSIADCEAYLSVFVQSPKSEEQNEYRRVYHAVHLPFDIDRNEAAQALDDARTLILSIIDDFHIDPSRMQICFSGRRGFHVSLFTETWDPPPSENFPAQAKLCCTAIARTADVLIDTIYDSSRLLRVVNTRHPKSKLFKIPLMLDELLNWKIDAIFECAQAPRPSKLPNMSGGKNTIMAELWSKCVEVSERRKSATSTLESQNPRIFHKTVDFIANGAPENTRNDRLFKAAVNMTDFQDRNALITGLLLEPAKFSGLSKGEALKTIESALKRKK